MRFWKKFLTPVGRQGHPKNLKDHYAFDMLRQLYSVLNSVFIAVPVGEEGLITRSGRGWMIK